MNGIESTHNKCAPYWAILMMVLCVVGVSTTWIKLGSFWNGYVLDITGPAWNYILFRNLFTKYQDNAWTRLFTPITTLIIFVLVLYGIEILQYFEVYDSTYDPWDFLAYISLLLPLFLIDYIISSKSRLSSKHQ